jgi:hypothetical protein
MVRIPRFRDKWAYFLHKYRAARISPEYFSESEQVTYRSIAKLIPADPRGRFPASGDDDCSPMTGTAFGLWISGEKIPDNRVGTFERLTSLPITVWSTDFETFTRAVRQASGELDGWNEFVESQAKLGLIKVHVSDRRNAERFLPVGANISSVNAVQVWPGCTARIELPGRIGHRECEDRRAWMVADYGQGAIYVLDPTRHPDGLMTPTRLGTDVWLPRGRPGYVWLPDTIRVGTRFDVIVLVVNLHSQPDEIRALFDSLEQRLAADPQKVTSALHQKNVCRVLDEAVSIIQEYDVRQHLYRQTCKVGDQPTMR